MNDRPLDNGWGEGEGGCACTTLNKYLEPRVYMQAVYTLASSDFKCTEPHTAPCHSLEPSRAAAPRRCDISAGGTPGPCREIKEDNTDSICVCPRLSERFYRLSN